MLSYHCTNTCRHCLYRCSSVHPQDFMSESQIDATFQALAAESGFQGVHLAGGEATLHPQRLEYALGSARRHNIRIDYLETNGGWCVDRKTAEDGFRRLRDFGLEAVLISASLFHNEFIPLRTTRTAIDAARKIFGGGVIVWTSKVLSVMEKGLDPDRTHTLKESCRLLGLKASGPELWDLHDYLSLSGRAAEALAAGLPRFQPDSFHKESCHRELSSTTHIHIDPSGNLFTGLCPGIAPGTIDNLHPLITREDFPVSHTLQSGGPCALQQRLAPGFKAAAKGYISKCHYCLDLRRALYRTGKHLELRGRGFYRST